MKRNIATTITAIIAFVCITVAALMFDNANILWWYIVATLIAID